jgi:subtilisin-like proprotein convertase family protein
MAKRLLALAVLILVAGFVSQEASRVGPSDGAGSSSTVSRLARVAMGGVVIALSPIGSMAGCGGGGPKPTSATAVALAEAVVDVGSAEAPVVAAGNGAGAVSHLAIADRRPVTDVAVSVRLSRATPGDVRITLRHPSGAEVVVYEGRTAGLASTFDAQSRPELRSLVSTSADGVWSLFATSRDGDATLESWSLRLRVRE